MFKLQQYINKAYRTISEGSLNKVTTKLSRQMREGGTFRILDADGKPVAKRKY